MDINSHGADIYSASKNSGIDENLIIDFSSNINPLGIPDDVVNAMINSIANANRYPDINNRELTYSISSHENVQKDWIFCSNGAAEAIFRIALCLKPKRALLTAPTFSEYEQALKTVSAHIDYYNLEEKINYKITDSIINSINDETDIIFICNPNNPTGQLTDKMLLERIISHCKSTNTVVVVDECFIDFVENKEKYSVNEMLKKYDNLIILKAFTKIYAMPGIRLGYLLASDKELLNSIKNGIQPWSVSVVAQKAGVAALDEVEYLNETLNQLKCEKDFLLEQLDTFGYEVYGSAANFIFFKGEANLFQQLLPEGIMIRDCSNFSGLDQGYFRIAVRTRQENCFLIETLRRIRHG